MIRVQILNLLYSEDPRLPQPLCITVSGLSAGGNIKNTLSRNCFSAYSCQPRKKWSLQKISQMPALHVASPVWQLHIPVWCHGHGRQAQTFSQNGIVCWKEVGDSNELQTFPWNGNLPKKATATKQPNGNHDISLNSEPNLPFFSFPLETFCVPCALGAKKKSCWNLFLHFWLRCVNTLPLLS